VFSLEGAFRDDRVAKRSHTVNVVNSKGNDSVKRELLPLKLGVEARHG
jgi:hypothetical protein